MESRSPVPPLGRDTEFESEFAQPPVLEHFSYPEKILQFGTGAFLRAFSNAFVDRANRDEVYRGRIVVVGSTGSGRAGLINEQEGLYTLIVKGVEDGTTVETSTVIGSVSRAVASTADWAEVRAFARSPELEFVISNTTEVGIQYDPDDRPNLDPPRSFPGKLTALLHDRAEAFRYAPSSGLTVLCCELIEGNGDRLREIVLKLAERWGFGADFRDWISTHNRFCNTLVDRIVPGVPDAGSRESLEKKLGYNDRLMVQAEPFCMWAIEGDETLRSNLPFASGRADIIVTPDIAPYRVRKVRILNGAHSVVVPLSYLCGNDTVAETMSNPLTAAFVRHVMLEEIVPSLSGELDLADATTFAGRVLDRFANPFVEHELLSIALQQTSKMDVRVLPSLVAYVDNTGRLPEGMVLGFAAFLLFVVGEGRAGDADLPEDERAGRVREHWAKRTSMADFAQCVCSDRTLWHHPLDAVQGFTEALADCLRSMHENGADSTLRSLLERRLERTNDDDF